MAFDAWVGQIKIHQLQLPVVDGGYGWTKQKDHFVSRDAGLESCGAVLGRLASSEKKRDERGDQGSKSVREQGNHPTPDDGQRHPKVPREQSLWRRQGCRAS